MERYILHRYNFGVEITISHEHHPKATSRDITSVSEYVLEAFSLGEGRGEIQQLRLEIVYNRLLVS